MKTIVNRHWTQGGTGVTNFSEDFDIFEEAVKEYSNPLLVIRDQPMQPGRPGAKSLHFLGEHRPDLSVFWELVRLIRTDRVHPQHGAPHDG